MTIGDLENDLRVAATKMKAAQKERDNHWDSCEECLENPSEFCDAGEDLANKVYASVSNCHVALFNWLEAKREVKDRHREPYTQPDEQELDSAIARAFEYLKMCGEKFMVFEFNGVAFPVALHMSPETVRAQYCWSRQMQSRPPTEE